MSEVMNGGRFVGFDYLEVSAPGAKVSLYLDCYECFGWQPDENVPPKENFGRIVLTFKRNRRIVNKVELTRLQRNFEACLEEIDGLEGRAASVATLLAIAAGLVGAAFVAGSVFAVTNEPPIIWLCVLLGLPGLLCWGLNPLLFKAVAKHKALSVRPLIEQKYDEIYEVCEKAGKLL